MGLSIFDPLPDFVGEPLEDGADGAANALTKRLSTGQMLRTIPEVQ
jgi:hypothetical protein